MLKKHYDLIIVGLGAMGAAALYQAAKRGVDLLGIDRFDPPHEMGSSHAETRLTRMAVGEGADCPTNDPIPKQLVESDANPRRWNY